MAIKRDRIDIKEVRNRAAEIRRQWSPSEKARRTGLPPDMPTRLRDFFLGGSGANWQFAASGAGVRVYSPLR